jgi:hydroxymethylpyrimidine/phosphomethylpyrimidine kinase
MIPNLLSIAGSDPSGGAGIQADLKTFAALGGYGMAVITALTAQNTQKVSAVHVPPVDFVAAEIDAIFADIEVAAVKIGMLGSGAVVAKVAERLAFYKPPIIVLDPVLVATSGDSLGSDDVVEALWTHLIPLATLITPNGPEAARLTGGAEPEETADMEKLTADLLARGAKAALVKGGHLKSGKAEDLLAYGKTRRLYSTPRIETKNTHGTGCTLSSAIATYLAQGYPLEDAVAAAKSYLTHALKAAETLHVGHGHGPLNHFAPR